MATKPKTPPKTSKNAANTGRKPADESNDGDEDGDEGDGDEDDIDSRINAIVTNRLKRFAKDTDKKLDGIMTAIAALKPATPSDEDGEGDEGDGDGDENETPAPKGKKGKSGMTAAEARKLARMEKELAEAKEARKAAEQAQKDAAEKAAREEERNIFAQALTAAGVTDGSLAKGALHTLISEGKITRNEDGKIVYKGVDKYGLEADLDPKAGVAQWLKGDGKAYIPAVAAGGSGADGSRANGGNGPSLSKSDYQKLSPRERAAIELERASQGLPPLQ